MQCRKKRFGSPILESDQISDTYFINSSLTEPIGRFETVTIVGLPPAQVINRITFAVVGLLIDIYRMQSVIHQHAVVVRIERLHLERDLLEVIFDNIHRIGHILYTRRTGSLARYQQNVFERILLDGLTLGMYLVRRQNSAMDLVRTVETTIDTMVLADVGQIERNIELNRISETATGNLIAFHGHFVQVFIRSRGNQCGKILHRRTILAQRPFDIDLS